MTASMMRPKENINKLETKGKISTAFFMHEVRSLKCVANRGHYPKGRQPSTEVGVPSSISSKPCKRTIMQFAVASPEGDAIIAIEINDICSLPAFTCQKLSAWIGYYKVTFCCQQRMILSADPKSADLMQPRRFSQRVLYAWGNPGNKTWSVLRLKCARACPGVLDVMG